MSTFLMGIFLKCVADVPLFLEFAKHNDKYYFVSLPACSVVPFSTIAFPLVHKFSLLARLVKICWQSIPGFGRTQEKGKATHFIFWPGEFHGQYNPWGRKESDTTERLPLSLALQANKTWI